MATRSQDLGGGWFRPPGPDGKREPRSPTQQAGLNLTADGLSPAQVGQTRPLGLSLRSSLGASLGESIGGLDMGANDANSTWPRTLLVRTPTSSKGATRRLSDSDGDLELPGLSGKRFLSMSASFSDTLRLPSPTSRHSVTESVAERAPTAESGGVARGQLLGDYMLSGKRGRREYYQVRHPEILLPAEGPGNDGTRVANCGQALRPRQMLASCDSEPALPSARGRQQVSRDPRDARGLVKTVSRVVLQYPEWDPYSTEGRPRRKPVYEAPAPPVVKRPPLPMIRPQSSGMMPVPGSPGATARIKRDPLVDVMSLKDTVELDSIRDLSSTLSPKGRPSRQLVKSMVMMDTFYKMRRLTGGPEDGAADRSPSPAAARSPSPAAPSEGGASEAPEEQDAVEARAPSNRTPSKQAGAAGGTLLTVVLRELDDTSESLRAQARTIADTQQAMSIVSGTRHATNVVMLRSFGVLTKKAELLQRVEIRLAQVEAEAEPAARALTLQKVINGEDPPKELLGLPKFVRAYTHRPGDPVDADRSDFNSFLNSFRLPREHSTLVRLRDLLEATMEHWAEAAYNKAQEGASKEQLEAIIALARDLGADDMHPSIRKAKAVLMERMADRVLRMANEALEKDNNRAQIAASNKKNVAYGYASKEAEELELEILKAEKEGVTRALYKQVATALDVVKQLRERDGERKRLQARDMKAATQKVKMLNMLGKS